MTTKTTLRLDLPLDRIADFCRRWKIRELAVFGSALRDDFTERSDVDFLATFYPGHGWSLFDSVTMEEELSRIVGRKADLVSKKAVEQSHNWIRRREILGTAQVVYEAR